MESNKHHSNKTTESENTIKPSHLRKLEMYETGRAVESTSGRALNRQQNIGKLLYKTWGNRNFTYILIIKLNEHYNIFVFFLTARVCEYNYNYNNTKIPPLSSYKNISFIIGKGTKISDKCDSSGSLDPEGFATIFHLQTLFPFLCWSCWFFFGHICNRRIPSSACRCLLFLHREQHLSLLLFFCRKEGNN